MKSATRALLAIVIFIGLCFGLLWWSVEHTKAKAAKIESQILTKLSAEDVALIIQSQAQGNPQQLAALNEEPEARQEILEDLKGLLAQAAAARRAGLAEDPEIKQQLELARKFVIARSYDQAQSKGQPAPPFGYVTEDEVNKFLGVPANDEEFQKIIDLRNKAIKAAGQKPPKLEGQLLKTEKEGYARFMVAYEKAVAENFDKTKDVQMQIGLQQALILSSAYAKTLVKKAEPSKAEIAAYLAAHPEYDVKQQRAKAETALQRVKAGEDFTALAKEYSEDPGSKDKGGLYEGIQQGQFVPEFEAAALSVENGQLVPTLVETQFGYHIIKLEDKKIETKDGKTGVTFSVRHILLQNKFPAPSENPMAQPKFLSGEEIARTKVLEDKSKKILEEIVAENKIELPPDFKVDVPEGSEAGQVPLPQQNLPDESEESGAPKKNGKAEQSGKPKK